MIFSCSRRFFEQPVTIAECMRGRMNADEGWVRLTWWHGRTPEADAQRRANRLFWAVAPSGTPE
jgi:hypothetical protein